MKAAITIAVVIAVLTGCASARFEPEPTRSMTDSLIPPLVVEYGGPIKAELTSGQTLTLHPGLRNAGRRRVAIAHGTRFFVLDAQFSPPDGQSIPLIYQFPRGDTWGEVKRLEYPNPSAVYTMPLIMKTLEPGELYAPALLFQRSEYVVPFDSAGRYAIRVCAHFTETILCGRRDISVTVK